eukprot:3346960-Pleurochrysis_carterae.AAC.1
MALNSKRCQVKLEDNNNREQNSNTVTQQLRQAGLSSLYRAVLERRHGEENAPHSLEASDRKVHQLQVEDSNNNSRGHKHKDNTATQKLIRVGWRSLHRTALKQHHGETNVPQTPEVPDREGHQPQVEGSSDNSRGHKHNDNTATQQLLRRAHASA